MKKNFTRSVCGGGGGGGGGGVALSLDYILLDPVLESKVINTSIKKRWFLRPSSGYVHSIYARKKRERSYYKLNTNLKKLKTTF